MVAALTPAAMAASISAMTSHNLADSNRSVSEVERRCKASRIFWLILNPCPELACVHVWKRVERRGLK